MYTKAHSTYEQADARSTIASSDNEMAQFATALAQRGQRFMVLAPGKTNGADKLLAWLVGDREPSDGWNDAKS